MGRQITWKEISQSQPSFKAKPVCFRPQGRAPSFHHGVVASTHLFGKNRNKYFIFCNLLLKKTTLKTFISYILKMMNQKTIPRKEISKFQIKTCMFPF